MIRVPHQWTSHTTRRMGLELERVTTCSRCGTRRDWPGAKGPCSGAITWGPPAAIVHLTAVSRGYMACGAPLRAGHASTGTLRRRRGTTVLSRVTCAACLKTCQSQAEGMAAE